MDSSHALYPLASALQSAIAEPNSELKVAALIAELIDPTSKAFQVEQQVLKFLHASDGHENVASLLAWFAAQGYQASTPPVVTEDHSHIQRVAEQRRGIPITAGVLLIEAARMAKIDAVGINQPGYFVVQLDGDYYDPLTLKPVNASEISGVAANAEMLALRMINNLKGIAFARSDLVRALDLIDLQIHFVSDVEAKATLAFEQGEVWAKLGLPSGAKAAFERVLEWSGIAEINRQAERRLADMQGQSETRH